MSSLFNAETAEEAENARVRETALKRLQLDDIAGLRDDDWETDRNQLKNFRKTLAAHLALQMGQGKLLNSGLLRHFQHIFDACMTLNGLVESIRFMSKQVGALKERHGAIVEISISAVAIFPAIR